jgi:hypothetical protein
MYLAAGCWVLDGLPHVGNRFSRARTSCQQQILGGPTGAVSKTSCETSLVMAVHLAAPSTLGVSLLRQVLLVALACCLCRGGFLHRLLKSPGGPKPTPTSGGGCPNSIYKPIMAHVYDRNYPLLETPPSVVISRWPGLPRFRDRSSLCLFQVDT